MPHAQPAGHLPTPSRDSRSEPAKAILVLHPWWGLNTTIKSFCDRLANEGFVVFAPDLFPGKTATTIAEAEALSSSADPNQVKRDILQAAAFLREHSPHQEAPLSVIGFSYGAYFALDLSVTHPELVDSVVVFYGTRPSRAGDYSRSTAKYLGHFAAADPFEPKEFVDQLEMAIRSAGRSVTFHHYADTGHWFFESDRPEYNKAAATVAWQRTLAFLEGPSTNRR